MKVIYFDTETTGLDYKTCQIIELAMLIVEDGTIVEEYDEFVNIGRNLPSDITNITGITDEMLASEGLSEERVAEDLKKNMTPGTIMIAHNCQFDLSFVYSLLKRHYPDDEVEDILKSIKWIDTVTILKDRKEFPHKLCDAVEYYGLEEVNFHRAIDDTRALCALTRAMIDERPDVEEYINFFGYNPKWGISEPKFPFITYRRQSFNNSMVSPDRILPKSKY
jgi:DNA polymerase III epsilon subunit family exonuclease